MKLLKIAPLAFCRVDSIVAFRLGNAGEIFVRLAAEGDTSIPLIDDVAEDFRRTVFPALVANPDFLRLTSQTWIARSRITRFHYRATPSNPILEFVLDGGNHYTIAPERIGARQPFHEPFWTLFEKITGHARPADAQPTDFDPPSPVGPSLPAESEKSPPQAEPHS